MANKIGAIIIAVATIVGVCLLWILQCNSYHYVGLEKMSIETARQLQIDKSNGYENNIQVMSYDSSSDEIYVSYNFQGGIKDAQKYGIPLGEEKDRTELIIITVVIVVIGGIFTHLVGWTLDY